jgi:hypothetical protein
MRKKPWDILLFWDEGREYIISKKTKRSAAEHKNKFARKKERDGTDKQKYKPN